MVLALGLSVSLLLSGQAQSTNLYPKDIAVILLNEGDVERETSLAVGFKKVEETAPSLLGPPVVPLADVPVAETTNPRLLPTPKQWEVPPFPTLEPALPKDLPPEILAQIQASAAPEGPRAPVFGDVIPYSYEVKAELRPRAQRPSDLLRQKGGDAPVPFSLRRYSTDELGFVQVSLYGGTTSINAEQIYQTLRAAALRREDIQGVGREGFLTRIPAPEPEVAVAEEKPAPEPPAPQEPARPSLGGFDEIAPTGTARPDYVDRGMAESGSAPSFRDVPTRLSDTSRPAPLPAAQVDETASAEDELALEPEEEEALPAGAGGSPLARSDIPGPSMLVLVAYFPDRAAVLEVAVDERICDVEKLFNLARQAQTRLGEVWTEQTQR